MAKLIKYDYPLGYLKICYLCVPLKTKDNELTEFYSTISRRGKLYTEI